MATVASSQEHYCVDDWGGYCYDKSWGSCPVTCTEDQTYCYSYVYDSTGQVDDVLVMLLLKRRLKCCEAMMLPFWMNLDLEGF